MATAGWNNTNCKTAIFGKGWKSGDNQADKNSGSASIYRGPSAGGSETATLTNMTSGYGFIGGPGHYRFDGVNDYIALNYGLSISDTSKHTIEFNGFISASSSLRILYGVYDDINNFCSLYVDASNRVRLDFVVGGTTKYALSTDAISTGINRIVGRKDGGTLTLWINGSEVSAYTNQDTYNLGTKTYSANAKIGALSTANEFDEYMYDFIEYDDAISSARISDNYDLGEWFGGIRVADSSGVSTLTEISDHYIATPTNENRWIRNSKYGFPYRIRGEYVPANDTNTPFVANLDKLFALGAVDSAHIAESQSNGSDVCVAKLDGTEIPCSVVRWDNSTPKGELALKADSITALTDGDILWIQWGGDGPTETEPFESTHGSNDFALAGICNGSAMVDHGPTGHTLTDYNTPTHSANGPLGGQVNFNNNASIRCGDHNDFSFGNGTTNSPFTIIVVSKFTDATLARMMCKYDTGGREYVFQTSGADLFALSTFDESRGGTVRGRYYNTAVSENQWSVYAGSSDGNQADMPGGINILINSSVVDDTTTSSGLYDAMENTSSQLRLGEIDNTLDFMDGLEALAYLIKAQLSDNQIKYHSDHLITAEVMGAWDGGVSVEKDTGVEPGPFINEPFAKPFFRGAFL